MLAGNLLQGDEGWDRVALDLDRLLYKEVQVVGMQVGAFKGSGDAQAGSTLGPFCTET